MAIAWELLAQDDGKPEQGNLRGRAGAENSTVSYWSQRMRARDADCLLEACCTPVYLSKMTISVECIT